MSPLRGTAMKNILRGFSLLAGLAAAPMSHATQIYKVGSDAACTHTTIQAAIDAAAASPGEDYVWIASNQTYNGQHVTIDGQVVDVVGGFADCSASEAGTAITTVSGAGNGGRSVFSVRGASHVFMSNLFIRDAENSGDGGGIDFAGSGWMKLAQTTVSLNQAEHGAGINFRGTGGDAELHIAHDTLILNNTAAVSGGGIRVEGSTRLFVLEPQILIAFNSAAGTDGKGGGIEQLAPARIDIGSPGYNGGAVVQFNDADYGGGIAVNTNNDSDVHARLFSTDPNNPVQITNNTARKTGGGIWINPCSAVADCYAWAYLCAQDFRIDDNIAQEGAAIYADVDTKFDGLSARSYVLLNHNSEFNALCLDPEPVESLGAVPCAAGVPCNELAYNVTENAAGDPTNGAVILMQTDGRLNAIRFRMHHNVAAHLIRSVDDDEGNTTNLSRCLFTDNQLTASAILHTPDGDGSVAVDECTFARNSIGSGAAVEVNHVDTTITRSIFDQPGVPVLSSPNWDHVTAVEVMAQDLSTLPFSTRDIQATPSFVDPEHGDYHLRPDSPGIDYADSDHVIDLDGNTRKVNLPAENVFGTQDLGALETQLGCSVSDSIFCDGFDLD
jgi:predicted outer membrane repeat protein